MTSIHLARTGLGTVGVAAALALLTACGSSASSGNAAAAGGGGASGTGGVPAGLRTESTPVGTVLADSSGRTVYELVGDSVARPTCTGQCLSVWPAVTANGHQVVVHGHPAYTFVGDRATGQVTGQDLTDQWGRWLALGADGDPITSSRPGSPASSGPASSPKAPGGGGPAF
ncbi:MAG: hypothetical protein ACTHMS_21695 [Jatrophihabitans sp.]|uniref:hypothetical protein n=1 Tax=Jatrophihabitans sp. TaxID=1932789 RepID=UPI003F818809